MTTENKFVTHNSYLCVVIPLRMMLIRLEGKHFGKCEFNLQMWNVHNTHTANETMLWIHFCDFKTTIRSSFFSEIDVVGWLFAFFLLLLLGRGQQT